MAAGMESEAYAEDRGDGGDDDGEMSLEDMLLESAMRGDSEGIAYAVENGADIDARDEDGNSAMLVACANGSMKAVKMLLRLGVSVDDWNDYREGPLHLCFGGGHSELGTYLIEKGADTALMTADGMDWAMFAEARGQDLKEFKAAMDLTWERESKMLQGAPVYEEDEEGDEEEEEEGDEGRQVTDRELEVLEEELQESGVYEDEDELDKDPSEQAFDRPPQEGLPKAHDDPGNAFASHFNPQTASSTTRGGSTADTANLSDGWKSDQSLPFRSIPTPGGRPPLPTRAPSTKTAGATEEGGSVGGAAPQGEGDAVARMPRLASLGSDLQSGNFSPVPQILRLETSGSMAHGGAASPQGSIGRSSVGSVASAVERQESVVKSQGSRGSEAGSGRNSPSSRVASGVPERDMAIEEKSEAGSEKDLASGGGALLGREGDGWKEVPPVMRVASAGSMAHGGGGSPQGSMRRSSQGSMGSFREGMTPASSRGGVGLPLSSSTPNRQPSAGERERQVSGVNDQGRPVNILSLEGGEGIPRLATDSGREGGGGKEAPVDSLGGGVTSMKEKLKQLEEEMKGLASQYDAQKPIVGVGDHKLVEEGGGQWARVDDSFEATVRELGIGGAGDEQDEAEDGDGGEGGDGYFSVEKCFRQLLLDEEAERHPSVHESLYGVEHQTNRVLTKFPKPDVAISHFQEIIDPTPESLSEELDELRVTAVRGIERRIADGFAIIMFNSVVSEEPWGLNAQMSLEIDRLDRALRVCGFSEILIVKDKTRSESLSLLRQLSVSFRPGGNLAHMDGLMVCMLGSGEVLSLDCTREANPVSGVLHDRPLRAQEMVEFLRTSLPGRPKILLHHVTASPAERQRANVEYPLRPVPGPLELYQEVADVVQDCMIIVCTAKEGLHWSPKGGSVWLSMLCNQMELLHRHLNSEEILEEVREELRKLFILRLGDGKVDCPKGIAAYEGFFLQKSMFVKSKDFAPLLLGPTLVFSDYHTQYPFEMARANCSVLKYKESIQHIHAVTMAWPERICCAKLSEVKRIAWEFAVEDLGGSFDLSVGGVLEKQLQEFSASRHDRSLVLESEFKAPKPAGTGTAKMNSQTGSLKFDSNKSGGASDVASARSGMLSASGSYKRGTTPQSSSEESLVYRNGWCVSALGGVFPGPLGYCEGYASGSRIEMWVDMLDNTVQFVVDGQHTGHVFENTPAGERLVPAITAGPYCYCTVELTRCWLW